MEIKSLDTHLPYFPLPFVKSSSSKMCVCVCVCLCMRWLFLLYLLGLKVGS